MHALLANDDTHRVRRLTRISLQIPTHGQNHLSDRHDKLTRNDRCGLLVVHTSAAMVEIVWGGYSPLLEEVTVCVDNIRLTQFMLNERHDMR